MGTAQDTHILTDTKTNLLFGELLIAKGLITREELLKALKEQSQHDGRLGEILLQLKKINNSDITSVLAEQLSLENIRFDDMAQIDMKVARMLPEIIAKRFCLVVIGEADDKVVAALADPRDIVAIDMVTQN